MNGSTYKKEATYRKQKYMTILAKHE